TEGPYFVDERLNRSDIRSDPSSGATKEGAPLRLNLTVSNVNGATCTPIVGAVVDMWHCDALGEYSDISGGAGQSDTSGQKFLRGYQVTDGNGGVQFQTIYPGWYRGRTIHIHFKVRTDPDAASGYEFTSQMFFDEAITDSVLARAPYNQKGSPDTRNARDNIFNPDLILPLTAEGDGYAGTLHIGVNIA
ncbi:MAG: intradiol ring-cleavage dioxygenase, partial [Chloroflexi bacterium]